MSNVVVLIPVRMASTRLPNKPLADINGKTMIEWIYEHIKETTDYDVCIAAGDQEIVDVVDGFGGNVVLTNPDLPSGSDRIAEALEKLDPEGSKYDIVVNFQGDAVNTRPEIITELVDLLEKKEADLTTPVMLMEEKNYTDSACVKAVAGFKEGEKEARALYFSREKVPHDRDGKQRDLYHHIGIYVYRANVLKDFVAADEGVLEQREKLEQLRALEIGKNIWVKLIDKLRIYDDAPADIDIQEELDAMRESFAKHKK